MGYSPPWISRPGITPPGWMIPRPDPEMFKVCAGVDCAAHQQREGIHIRDAGGRRTLVGLVLTRTCAVQWLGVCP